VLAVRKDGAPPLPLPQPSPAELSESAEPIIAPAVSKELRAAKWYTVSFLIFMGLFSIVGLIAMILITIELITKATE
jgi:hypothetical protein